MLRIIVSSIVLSIATNLTFTLYVDPFGITNTIGHLFQLGSFYMVYVAFIETSLTKPHEILFRELKQNEEKLIQNLRKLDDANIELNQEIAERKHAQLELERMRNLLAEGEKIAQMGTFEYIAEGQTTVWSEEEYRIYGLDPSEPSPAYNDMLANCIHPDFAAKLHQTFTAAMQNNSVYEFEHRIVRPDGSSRWVHDRAHPYFDENGKLTRHIGATLDITERKQMEEELRKSRDELDLRVQERTAELALANKELREKAEIIDFAHDAITVRGVESRITFWNRGAQETYGFTSDEALGRISHDLLKTRFPGALEDLEKTVVEKGEWKGELRHTKANGERVVVDSRWAIQAGRDGAPVGFLEVSRDITAKKIAEEELRKADRAFRTLSEFNQTLVRQREELELLREVCRIVIEVGGYQMAWVGIAENDENKTLRPIVSAGYDNGYLDLAGITWADTEKGRGPGGTAIRTGKMAISQSALTNANFAPWRSEATRRGYASSIALPLIVERKVIGTLIIYASEPDAFDQAESNLLNDLAQNLSYGIASIRSAEKRRQSEKELRIYASRLETINAELQEFAFVASHDLQEPLRKIQTFCDLAIKNCSSGLGTKTEDYLEKVANSASRMRELLRDMLEFSRIASRAQPFTNIDLTATVREAADVFEPTVEETGCKIEIHELPSIEADQSQMFHLFQNLIGNSLKYRNDKACHIEISGKMKNDACEIIVEDNGIGFEQQYSELIFKPFQRLHKRGEYSGTGMGLSICRKIAERHGGTIRADGVSGKGAVFTILLPLKQARLEGVIADELS